MKLNKYLMRIVAAALALGFATGWRRCATEVDAR